MKLTFGTHQEPDKVLVAECSTSQEMWNAIDNHLAKEGIKPDYTRLVELDNNSVMLDFGSWTRFFFMNISFAELMKLEEERKQLQQHD